MTLNDLEPPEEGFWWIFLQFLAAVHISTVNCDEMAEDRLQQSACEIFSIEQRFWLSKSEACAVGRQWRLSP